MTDPQATKHFAAFAELGRVDFSRTDLATALATVAELARHGIPVTGGKPIL